MASKALADVAAVTVRMLLLALEAVGLVVALVTMTVLLLADKAWYGIGAL